MNTEHVEMELVAVNIGQTNGYNHIVRHYEVTVTMMSQNVTVPSQITRIEATIRAMFPDTSGIGASRTQNLSSRGVVRTEDRTNQYGKTHEWATGKWTFDYEISGND